MKIRLMMLALVSMPLFSFAQDNQDIFVGESTYSRSCRSCSNNVLENFDELYQLGIQRAAEIKALDACREAGFAYCALLSARITSCNKLKTVRNELEEASTTYKSCSATAKVKGLK